MRSSSLTRPAAIRLVLVLFLLATSGFTTALHHCVMGGMASCACDEGNGGAPPTGQRLTDDLNCCSTVLAGGLNHLQTTVTSTEPAQKLPPAGFAVSPAVAETGNASAPAAAFLPTSSRGAPPCSRELYLLTATFRI